MLEKEAGNIDAVLVGTPDHTHAAAALLAATDSSHSPSARKMCEVMWIAWGASGATAA